MAEQTVIGVLVAVRDRLARQGTYGMYVREDGCCCPMGAFALESSKEEAERYLQGNDWSESRMLAEMTVEGRCALRLTNDVVRKRLRRHERLGRERRTTRLRPASGVAERTRQRQAECHCMPG